MAARPASTALLGFFNQTAAFGRDFADAEHARRIAVIAVKNGGAVNIDDIALFQHVALCRECRGK